MKKNSLVLLGLVSILAVSSSACGKKEEVVETSVEQSSVVEEETTSSTLETDVEEVKETVVGIGEVSKEDSINIDEIINELSDDVKREKVDLGEYEESVGPSDRDIKEQADREFEESLRESLGLPEEETVGKSEEGVPDRETEYDVDDNPNTREVIEFEEETEPIIGEDGAIVETVDIMIQKSKEHAYAGPTIEENSSESMQVGRVYNYFLDDGSSIGQVGDYVMCGKLAMNVAPVFSIPGYIIKSYDDTVEIKTDIGSVYVRKLNTDSLEVEKMTLSQINRLSGLNNSFVYSNATKGSFGAYSMCVTDNVYTNGVQYYKCNFGTYEIKYESSLRESVFYLIASICPESSLNEIAVAE